VEAGEGQVPFDGYKTSTQQGSHSDNNKRRVVGLSVGASIVHCRDQLSRVLRGRRRRRGQAALVPRDCPFSTIVSGRLKGRGG
jgi:hypothetical protein